jgi:hypothetical protein
VKKKCPDNFFKKKNYAKKMARHFFIAVHAAKYMRKACRKLRRETLRKHWIGLCQGSQDACQTPNSVIIAAQNSEKMPKQ